jgi:OmpR family response regulator RpaB
VRRRRLCGKPFSPKELEARVKAILRRTTVKASSAPTAKDNGNQIVIGSIKIDTAKRQVLKKTRTHSPDRHGV